MSFSVGIGIVTYNRKTILSDTIDRVRALTRQSGAALVIADDGSTDGTLQMLRDKQVPVITGVNMGIAWNKNRALFLLAQMLNCETVILLEDDVQPNQAGWEAEWIRAARRWGHINHASNWMQEHFISGAGTADDPVCSNQVTAQCSAYSWHALSFGGYFDPRFRGYGYEHVEHTRRLVRVGYGGTDQWIDGEERVQYYLLKGRLVVVATPSFRDPEQEERNLQLARRTMGAQGYRAPWGEDKEMRQFRAETESAMSDGAARFCLTPAIANGVVSRPTARGFLGRLMHRA